MSYDEKAVRPSVETVGSEVADVQSNSYHRPSSASHHLRADESGAEVAPIPMNAASGIKEKLRFGELEREAVSVRFEADSDLKELTDGKSHGEGAKGVSIRKLGQALVELGYLTQEAATGQFNAAVTEALIRFQEDSAVGVTGRFDVGTVSALVRAYAARKPYIANARRDAAHPGTHELYSSDATAAMKAMLPASSATAANTSSVGASTFVDVVGGKKYGDEVKRALKSEIARMHKELFEDVVKLRDNPKENFYDWKSLEAASDAAKQVVDGVYGSNYKAVPALSHHAGSFVDQWEDEVASQKQLDAKGRLEKAVTCIGYLLNNNIVEVNKAHGASPDGDKEKTILAPIVHQLAIEHQQQLLENEMGWQAAQVNKSVFVQRFKSTNVDKTKAKEEDRLQMWKVFQTCIHEYIHFTAHPRFAAWVAQFSADDPRRSTLAEGFCDFFTINVRSVLVANVALCAKVEGPYANGNPPPPNVVGMYDSHAQAEQVVSISGIKNAQAAYFEGKIELIGGMLKSDVKDPGRPLSDHA
jgi:Putative peptidoglycan binding domain